jgi:hypothetical protein
MVRRGSVVRRAGPARLTVSRDTGRSPPGRPPAAGGSRGQLRTEPHLRWRPGGRVADPADADDEDHEQPDALRHPDAVRAEPSRGKQRQDDERGDEQLERVGALAVRDRLPHEPVECLAGREQDGDGHGHTDGHGRLGGREGAQAKGRDRRHLAGHPWVACPGPRIADEDQQHRGCDDRGRHRGGQLCGERADQREQHEGTQPRAATVRLGPLAFRPDEQSYGQGDSQGLPRLEVDHDLAHSSPQTGTTATVHSDHDGADTHLGTLHLGHAGLLSSLLTLDHGPSRRQGSTHPCRGTNDPAGTPVFRAGSGT